MPQSTPGTIRRARQGAQQPPSMWCNSHTPSSPRSRVWALVTGMPGDTPGLASRGSLPKERRIHPSMLWLFAPSCSITDREFTRPVGQTQEETKPGRARGPTLPLVFSHRSSSTFVCAPQQGAAPAECLESPNRATGILTWREWPLTPSSLWYLWQGLFHPLPLTEPQVLASRIATAGLLRM